jgi:hypothetical protein
MRKEVTSSLCGNPRKKKTRDPFGILRCEAASVEAAGVRVSGIYRSARGEVVEVGAEVSGGPCGRAEPFQDFGGGYREERR